MPLSHLIALMIDAHRVDARRSNDCTQANDTRILHSCKRPDLLRRFALQQPGQAASPLQAMSTNCVQTSLGGTTNATLHDVRITRASRIVSFDEAPTHLPRISHEISARQCDRLRPIRTTGGARRDRTDDLMLAKHALSQLSYGPVSRSDTCSVRAPDDGGPGKT